MSDGQVRAQQLAVGRHGRYFFGQGVGIVGSGHHRAELQREERALAVAFKAYGKLHLHFAAHCLAAVAQEALQECGEGEDVVLKHTAEGDDLAPAVVDAVAQDHVVGVVG